MFISSFDNVENKESLVYKLLYENCRKKTIFFKILFNLQKRRWRLYTFECFTKDLILTVVYIIESTLNLNIGFSHA